jgi:hypothetical protein
MPSLPLLLFNINTVTILILFITYISIWLFDIVPRLYYLIVILFLKHQMDALLHLQSQLIH